MTNLVDAGRFPWTLVHGAMSRAIEYIPYGAPTVPAFNINAFLRGLRADDLFGSALQSDVVAIINAADLKAALPGRPRPLRYDRLHALGQVGLTYTVEEWRGSPHYDQPIFFKLLLRGGNQ